MDVIKTLLGRISGSLGGLFGFSSEFKSARITPRRAIEYAPVWYAVNKVAGHFSQLPINCHKRLERGSEIDRKHAGHRLVHTRPNSYQTAPEWKMQGAYNLLLLGNWRCAIVRQGGKPVELLPFNAPSHSIWVDGVRYHGSTSNKHDPLSVALGLQEDGTPFWLKDQDVLFVHGLSTNGLEGVDPSAVMSNSLDAGLSAEDQVRNLAKKGFSGSLILESPSGMFRNEEEAKKFLAMFREAHDGSENAGKTAMLREGIKANVVTMSGRESQWIEQRLFQRQEAAMWFCLEEILGDDSSVSYNSLAEKHLAYLTNCLNRWLVHIEAACDRSLLTERQIDNQSHFFKFNTKALMRMDPLKQAEYLTKLIAGTVISPNEAREILDMNPYEGGDKYTNPAITVAETMDETGENDDEMSENDDKTGAEAAKRAAIVSRLRHLLEVEQSRVNRAVSSKRPVIELEKFYSKWVESLADVVEELGGERTLAEEHCRESQDQILTIMQSTDKESFANSVNEQMASWSNRPEKLATKILETEYVLC